MALRSWLPREGSRGRVRAVAPGTESEQATRSVTDFLPPYAVVLHNDDVNSMDHVVHALLSSVPELTPERAVEAMMTGLEVARSSRMAR